MNTISPALAFFIHLAKAKTVVSRRFDNRLSFLGLGLSDFLILYHLYVSNDGTMRRTDLAEHVGLTASGVTRQLLPMEKIGLIKRESQEHDARVSMVALTPAGKRLFAESLERAELLAQELVASLRSTKNKDLIKDMSQALVDLGKITGY